MKCFHLFYIQLIALYGIVVCPSNPRVNILNQSKEAPAPISFWPMSSSLHDTNFDERKRYAMLNGSLLSGPGVYNTNQYGYIDLSHSSVDIISGTEELSGQDAMTWLLYIKPNTLQASTILQYEGLSSSPGFTFGINGYKLFAFFKDQTDTTHYFESDFTINIGEWQFVGFTFNKMWVLNDHIDLLKFSSSGSPTETTYGMGYTEMMVNAVGHVRIGRNWDDEESFLGHITCVQFYNTSLLGQTLEESFDLCDPNLNTLPGDYTISAYQADGVDCGVPCEFNTWGAWSECSETCGGGRRNRTKSMCCPVNQNLNGCLHDTCNGTIVPQETNICNSNCYNGGTFIAGRCACTNGWGDTCCLSIVRCSTPDIPSFSRLVVQDYFYTNQSAVVCNIGYAVSSGDAIRTCNSTGHWNGTMPICSRADWDYTPDGDYGTFTYLLVDKSTLSKQKRKRISVYEETTSKMVLGIGGIVFIVLFFAFFLCMDCSKACCRKRR